MPPRGAVPAMTQMHLPPTLSLMYGQSSTVFYDYDYNVDGLKAVPPSHVRRMVVSGDRSSGRNVFTASGAVTNH